MKRFDMSTILSVCVLIILTVAGCAEMEANSYFNRALTYGKKGQHDQAIADYTKAIEINPGHAMAYYNRGRAYAIGKGQYDQAIADYTKAIEINPGHAMAYCNRALTYGKKGQYGQAIADYNKAIEINPRFILAYNNRGIVMMKLGNTKMACSDWKQTCELGDCHDYETAKTNGWCK
jgi:tetratricopeptide (TPR) repeat protein